MAVPTRPTLAGFTGFIRTIMGIDATILPDDSPFIPFAYAVSLEIVNVQINIVSCLMYTLAVYNLGGDNIINYADDLPDAAPYPGSQPPLPYFAYMRSKWNINGFVSGVIQSASDEGTSESMVVQEAAKNFTLSDVQNLKTPYGRQYLAIAQRTGTIWGLS